ncbi:MAG TPA: hypothetical protein VNG90_04025 [Candidatus Acidoferrum sp.]|nr:hypothetical protein [Candidatus Acidoferrum sp.]
MSLTSNEKEQLFNVSRFFRRLQLHRNVLKKILVDRQTARLQPGQPFLVNHRYVARMLGVQQAESFGKRLAINQYGTRVMREMVEIGVLHRYSFIPCAYEFALPLKLISESLAIEPEVADLLRISGIVFMLLRVAAYDNAAEAAACLRRCLPHACTGEVTPYALYSDLGTSESALCRDLKPAREAGLVVLNPIVTDRRRHEYCFPGALTPTRTPHRFTGPQLAKLISNYLLATCVSLG